MEIIARETELDPGLIALKRCIQEGWKAGECMAYANYKEELCYINGVIMKGQRVVIPTKLRKEHMDRIHVGHLGMEKQKRMARQIVFWPKMNKEIEQRVQECSACQKFRPAQRRETFKCDEDRNHLGPWERVGVDLFTWEREEYLLAIDYYSNYPEMVKFRILALKQ